MDLLMAYLLSFLSYVLPFLTILTVIVFVHELGHYVAARYNNVRVDIFSIGFGYELFGYTDRHGTRWKFGAIPLGGYVKMFGEVDILEISAQGGELLPPKERSVAFRHKKLSQRAVIIAAGPAMNFLFAILVFTLIFMTLGQPITPPIVGEVKPGSSAEMAGIQPGDRFIAIDSRPVEQFSDIQKYVQLSNGTPLEVHLQRDTTEFLIVITPNLTERRDHLGKIRRVPVLGVTMSPSEPTRVQRHTPLSALKQAIQETYDVTRTALVAFGQMLIGARDTDELSGILRIAHFSNLAVKGGFSIVVTFIAILSINLGLVNLFPIPLLDGGHLLFYTIEAIRRRPLTEKTQEYGLRIGLILVFGLVLFATWNDLIQLGVWDFLAGLIS